MAPWEELPYFAEPIVTTTTMIQNVAKLIAPRNPMRVSIIFGTLVGSGNTAILPAAGASGPPIFSGLAISSVVPFGVTHADYPGLPQQEWWAKTGFATGDKVTTVEIIALRWPTKQQGQPAGEVLSALATLLRLIGASRQ